MSTSEAQRFRFGRLWTAAIASNVGDGLVLAAFPLLAATMTTDPIAISAITIASGIPWLVLAPISGAIVDRSDRRILMVAIDTVRASALIVFTFAMVTGSGSIWALYAVVLVIASGETIVDTSSQAILPSIVPRDDLDRANGRLFSTMTVANRFVGPPLGGYLFGVAVVAPIIADAASFAIAALLIFTLVGRFKPDTGASSGVTLRASIAEGMKWLWHHKPIRAFAIGAALINIGIVSGEAILVLFARDELSLTGVGYGALFAAMAAGYAAGSALAPALAKRHRRLHIVGVSVALISGSLLAIGLAGHWIVASLGLVTIGVASGLWDVIAVSYRQAAVPDRLLGRIMAAYRVLAHGSVPAGAILGGVAASLGGNRAAFIIGAFVSLLAVFYVVLNLRSVELDPRRLDPIG